MLRIVVDLGNSRFKLGRVESSGRLVDVQALPAGDPDAWTSALDAWDPAKEPADWAVSTVNPPAAERLARLLDERCTRAVRWFRSAADVPVRHRLESPETAGADRALAVAAAIARQPAPGTPGLVVSCGTAITVERVTADGVWQGGAIAPSLAISARALHAHTAQLPLVVPRDPAPAWGNSTRPAMEAGLFWGVVGAVRELLSRQSADMGVKPWLVWTGGEASRLAPHLDWPGAQIVPDLVLEGLARVVFSGPGSSCRSEDLTTERQRHRDEEREERITNEDENDRRR